MKRTYKIITVVYCLFMVMDGGAGLARVDEGVEIMNHLRYPVYVLSILGLAKILGALAIIQERLPRVKEWAYAGFTFHFLGACASRAFAGDSLLLILSPIMFLAFMSISWILWNRLYNVQFYTNVQSVQHDSNIKEPALMKNQ